MRPLAQGGGGGGDTHAYVTSAYFWGSKFEYFLGYEDFVDIFRGNYKIRLYSGGISMYFMVFV